jgi:hypothetical protein
MEIKLDIPAEKITALGALIVDIMALTMTGGNP